jgi:DNA adenine methylase Dam
MNQIIAKISLFQFDTYIEPFSGSLSVLLALISRKIITRQHKVIVSDKNEALMRMYSDVKQNPNELLAGITQKIQEINNSDDKEKCYNGFREQYNKAPLSMEKSQLFIFLNITCFNGLYRINSKGEFNVPKGRNAKDTAFELTDAKKLNILTFSKILNEFDITIESGDYKDIIGRYKTPTTLTYLDPPYYPINDTSFTAYMGDFNQKEYFEFCRNLDIHVVASNSKHIAVRMGLYNFTHQIVELRRTISSKTRDLCEEYISDNFPIEYVKIPEIVLPQLNDADVDQIDKLIAEINIV